MCVSWVFLAGEAQLRGVLLHLHGLDGRWRLCQEAHVQSCVPRSGNQVDQISRTVAMFLCRCIVQQDSGEVLKVDCRWFSSLSNVNPFSF